MYNGWKNRITWQIWVHISNTEIEHTRWKERIEMVEAPQLAGYMGSFYLIEVGNQFEEPDDHLWIVLMEFAIEQVDWLSIAKRLTEED